MATASAPTDGTHFAGWFVTARHRQTGRYGAPRPWGGVHVKRVGEPKTACGTVSLGWQVFWHVSAEAVLPDLCEECRTAALAEAHKPTRRCDAC